MLLVGAVVGAVGGWLARGALLGAAEGRSSSSSHSEAVAQPGESAASRNLPPSAARATSVPSTKTVSGRTDLAGGEEAPLYGAVLSTSPAIAIASESQPVAASPQPPMLDDLLDSANIRCTFGPGNGGSWPQGKLTVGDAAWQGGPVDFQSIDIKAGTAQMLGNVARSRSGQMPVTVSATSSGINFAGTAGNGTLTVITMFSRFDNAGHHTAVLSMHDGQQDIDTAQFYGSCESTLKRLNAG